MEKKLKELIVEHTKSVLKAHTLISALEGLLQQMPGHPVAMALLSGGYCMERDNLK